MSQQLPEGTVTVLFTDVVGSTDLTTSRGDEAAQEILRAQRDLVRQQVEEHAGHEVKTMGDGFMVAFTSARRAVACSVGIQRALEEHNHGQPPEEQVLIRIGLNTGEVIQEEADLFGETVNAAARIAAKAKGGQVLVSEAVRAVLGRSPDAELVDRGRFRLKGFPERWHLFEVGWQEETIAAPALVERTPFVGRESERAELRRLLDQAAKGQGALAMIGGEPGVGKTRMAEELMAEARQRGMTALIGHCYEMEGAPPYIPYVEILEAAARLFPPEALRDVLGESAPEVAKLMPELRRLFPDIPAPPKLPPEQERRYLFNGMRDFLTRVGLTQPLLLLLDDLQWADDATLLLVQHIAQQLQEMPVLIVGTYRDVEMDVAGPLARTLEELLRQRLAHRITLRRLPQDGVSAMLRALSGQEAPRPLVGAVYSETEGNPFFVEEVFQHLAEEGKLFDAKGRWRSDLRIDELDVPEGVRLVIERRLERVSENCRRVLTSAAVIGRAFSFELLEALGDASTGSAQAVDPDALLDAVDEAERANLIASAADDAEARFTFAHELIRQTLLSGVSLPHRQRLHLRVAEAMERLYARALEERAADLAHHLSRAGTAADPQKTAQYLTLAGDRAQAMAAFEDALRLYESALSLQPADGKRGRADLLFKRGLALRSLGDWGSVLGYWREAVNIYETLGEAEALGRICVEMSMQLNWSSRFLEAAQTAQRGVAALGDKVNADRCHLLVALGLALSLVGQYQAARLLIEQALAMAQQLGDERLLGRALAAKFGHENLYQERQEGLTIASRAAQLLRASGDLWFLADMLGFVELGLICLGRMEESVRVGEELEALAKKLSNYAALINSLRSRAFRDLLLAPDFDRLKEFVRQDFELTQGMGPLQLSGSYVVAGLLQFGRGRWDKAVDNLQEAARVDADVPRSIGSSWAMLFMVRAYARDKEGALALLRENRDRLPRSGQPNLEAAYNALFFVVEGLAVLGEKEEAAKLHDLILDCLSRGVIISFWIGRLLHHLAGTAAAAGGRWGKAEEHYEVAMRQAHEIPVVIEQPEVRRWYACMLIDRDGPGDRDKAFRLLTEAIAMYRRIGMPKHVEMAEALLEEV